MRIDNTIGQPDPDPRASARRVVGPKHDRERHGFRVPERNCGSVDLGPARWRAVWHRVRITVVSIAGRIGVELALRLGVGVDRHPPMVALRRSL
jgi:hypothetical protein